MSNTNEMLQRMCNGIATELKAVYDGEIIATEEEAERMGIEVGEPISLWDYFLNDDGIYNIDYIVSDDKETLTAVRLMVACGGPNIYINTWENAVQGYWWGDTASAWIPYEVAEAITEVFQEFWAMR